MTKIAPAPVAGADSTSPGFRSMLEATPHHAGVPSSQGDEPMLLGSQFIWAWFISRRTCERGASLVEYALLVALVALVCIAALVFLGTEVSSKYSHIGSGVAG
jgi:pilus assembly protein Flp/PilA